MALLWLVAIPLALAAGGAAYQQLGVRRDRERYPAPGRVVDAGGVQLHVHSQGEGDPAVVLEAGIAASSASWTFVQRALSGRTRVVSYDRLGYAWSGPCVYPRSPDRILSEFRDAIEAAGVRRPFVLVGHSFGGLIARLYACRYPSELAGVVLVDSALLSEWENPSEERRRMLERGVRLSRRGAALCRVGLVRFALAVLVAGGKTLPKAIARASSSPGGQSTLERLVGEVRKLPEEQWPAIRSHWSRPEAFESMAEHLAVLPAVAREVAQCRSFGDLPLTVISGAHLKATEAAEHQSVARLSTRGRHVTATTGGHWVHLDDPDLVVRAVEEILERANA